MFLNAFATSTALEDSYGEAEEDSVSKRLKTDVVPKPKNSYIIQMVVEKLQAAINVGYFQSPKSAYAPPNTPIYEPFMTTFRSIFGNKVQDLLLIDAMGARCDSSHQFIPNKKGLLVV